MAFIAALANGAGQILGRTLLLQPNTASGIPVPMAVLDVVKQEAIDYDAEVTDHPTEAGPEVSDHVQLLPIMIRLKGTISNTPLDLSVAIANIAAGAYASITSAQARSNILNSAFSQSAGIIGASLQGNAGDFASSAFAGAVDAVSRTILIAAWLNKTPFTLITKRQSYPSVVIKKLRFPREEETGYTLDFEMDIKQIKIVTALTVLKQSVSENVISSASSSVGLGSQVTQVASAQVQSAVASSPLGSAPGIAAKFAGVFH